MPTAPRSSLSRPLATQVLLAVLALSFRAEPVAAQSSDWTSVHQDALWVNGFVDHAVSSRDANVGDFQWRRMEWGAEPQQFMWRLGLLRTIASGVRVGGGYAYAASAPYGEVPLPTPTREHRAWQQLLLTHRAGAMTVAHRYRLEQRWIAPVTTDPATDEKETGSYSYQNRARYQVRAHGNLPMKLRTGPLIGFVYDELLIPFGHGDPDVRVAQNRLGGGIGIPLSARQRLDVGYMNLWNALTAQRANEINHTLTISWNWTATR
jgi:hypothetical protein